MTSEIKNTPGKIPESEHVSGVHAEEIEMVELGREGQAHDVLDEAEKDGGRTGAAGFMMGAPVLERPKVGASSDREIDVTKLAAKEKVDPKRFDAFINAQISEIEKTVAQQVDPSRDRTDPTSGLSDGLKKVLANYKDTGVWDRTLDPEFHKLVINGNFLDKFRAEVADKFSFDAVDLVEKNRIFAEAAKFLINPNDTSIHPQAKEKLQKCHEIAKAATVELHGLDGSWKPELNPVAPLGTDPVGALMARQALEVANEMIQSAIRNTPPTPEGRRALSMFDLLAEMTIATLDCFAANQVMQTKMSKKFTEVAMATIASNVAEQKRAADEVRSRESSKSASSLFSKIMGTILKVVAVVVAFAVLGPGAGIFALAMAVVSTVGEYMDPPRNFISEGVTKFTEVLKSAIPSPYAETFALVIVWVVCGMIASASPSGALSLFFESGAFTNFLEASMVADGMDPDKAKFIAQTTNMAVGTAAQLAHGIKEGIAAAKENIAKLTALQNKLKLAGSVIQSLGSIGKSGADINTTVIEMLNLKVTVAVENFVLLNTVYLDLLSNVKSSLIQTMKVNDEMMADVAKDFSNTAMKNSRLLSERG